jgi:hypothetical protein
MQSTSYFEQSIKNYSEKITVQVYNINQMDIFAIKDIKQFSLEMPEEN